MKAARALFITGAASIIAMLLAWVASRFGVIVPQPVMLTLAALAFGCGVGYAIVYTIAGGDR